MIKCLCSLIWIIAIERNGRYCGYLLECNEKTRSIVLGCFLQNVYYIDLNVDRRCIMYNFMISFLSSLFFFAFIFSTKLFLHTDI